ncbi:aureobasidin A1 biosynthesis complex [Penicillium cosmopolitanum]|uniref:Aureobasidin A1 biosynthesis complex n=1 Tax=Penicillium cosmopolitanum TaxID=1131564 RepID=A0A9X0BE95_9EURO|nr:aureobasidin A1 biosynthesis complex [Penicillium cosmopolitanum]KAJ5413869.1 aureobasidin A1 biosynthesis complex [Penicillium cosmopolitanum]
MAIESLENLFAGGERMRPEDAARASRLLKGGFYHVYGPTENTTYSTICQISYTEPYANGVPVGGAISNSGALVMDARQRLVPLGVMGELVVTGDGLARGYTDPTLNRDRFIEVTVDGETLKAYRTGDRVRYRPTDGQLEFFGRLDHQIKLRGNRIELGEVEHAIRRDTAVDEAVALLRTAEGEDPELVSFITLHRDRTQALPNGHTSTADEEAEQVGAWADHFDAGTYADVETIDPARLGRDFVGWTSMYDGSTIDRGEMNEWLDDTMAAIEAGGRPANVCEIGTGTGMILFNLPDSLQSYVGLDPSAAAVAFVKRMAAAHPTFAGKVQLHVGTATDLEQIGPLNSPDVIVINSVAQYFPTAEYLSDTVAQLLQVDGVQRVFFGDMRSWALYREFGTTKALHALGDATTKEAVRAHLASTEEAEEELLVDPAFFTRLPALLPNAVSHVEILPKRMEAANELSCYRYAAVIHARQLGTPPPQVLDVDAWTDFTAAGLDREGLRRLLHTSAESQLLAVSNITNAKTAVERYVIDSLDAESEDAPVGEKGDWLSSARKSARDCCALSAHDLEHLAREAGFRVEISWARQRSIRGGFDAVFHRMEGLRPLFRFPTDHETCREDSLANHPLHRQLSQKIEGHLRAALQAALPAYMVPSRIQVLRPNASERQR